VKLNAGAFLVFSTAPGKTNILFLRVATVAQR
jgi:hypothetical protein